MPETHELDLTGLKCPMPIVKLTKLMRELECGEEVAATASDPAFCLDVEAWCNKTGSELVRFEETGKRLFALLRKR